MSGGPDRKVVLALLGIAALCMIGLGASLYHAKAAELDQFEQELLDKEDHYTEICRKVKQLPDLEDQYTVLQERLAVLEPGLPDSAYIPTFLRQIENLAGETKNAILLIRPKPTIRRSAADAVTINDETGEIVQNAPSGAPAEQTPTMPYDFRPIELRMEGTYWTMVGFLEQLRQFPKMIAVNDVSFSPRHDTGQCSRSPDLTATMELTAVILKGDEDGRSA
jgi:Tfp pilus assembly protein PilO